MILDLKTLVIIELTVISFSIILFSSIKKDVPYKNAMNTWIICSFSTFIAFCLLLFQGKLPNFLTIVIQNTLFLYSYSLFLRGVRLIFNKKTNNFVELTVPLFLIPFMFYFTYVDNSIIHRNEIFSVFNIFYHILILINISNEKFSAKWLIISVYLFNAFVFVLKLFGSRYLTSSNNFFNAGILMELNSWSSISVILATTLFIQIVVFENMMKRLDKNLERERETKNALEKSNKFKIDFIANISHELRTPLSGIIGNTELLKLKKKNSKELKNIMNLSKHLLLLINQLIDFAKIEKEKVQVENSEFSLRELLEEISNIFKKKLSDKKVLLLIYVDKKIPEKITGDYIKIKQILINIIGNSVKFTDFGKIEVNIKCIDFSINYIKIRFEIIDSGIGIDPHVLNRIFESFEQGEIDLSKKYEGTGLGLTISKNFVELMGGKINVESKPNSGSKFYFDLSFNSFTIQEKERVYPRFILVTKNKNIIDFLSKYFLDYKVSYSIVDDNELLEKELKKYNDNITLLLFEDSFEIYNQNINLKNTIKTYFITSGKQNIKKYFYRTIDLDFKNIINLFYVEENHNKNKNPIEKITFNGISALIVDDSFINIEIMKEYLDYIKIYTETASSGEECISLIKEKVFDIIFLDIQLPKLNGFDVLKILKKIVGKETLIVAFTASGGEEFKKKCIEAGFDEVLRKPFYFDEILTLLNKYFPNNNILNEVIDEYLQGEENKQIINEDYISLLIQSIEEDISKLKKDITLENFENIKKFAHMKKGAALQIKQKKLAEILMNLENSGTKKDINGINESYKKLILEINDLKH